MRNRVLLGGASRRGDARRSFPVSASRHRELCCDPRRASWELSASEKVGERVQQGRRKSRTFRIQRSRGGVAESVPACGKEA